MSRELHSASREGGVAGARPEGRRTRTRVAAVQMVSGPDVAANLREAERLIAIAAGRGAELIALPEYFPVMGMDERDKVKVREEEGSGPIQAFLANAAQRHKAWIVGGSVPLVASTSDKVRNSCLVFDHTGRRVARYDKIHLFWFEMGAESYSEPRTIEAGKDVVVLDSPFGRIGLSICYDLRFPELYRAMRGVDLILAPSAFTATTGKAHWETLIRARAIENLAYVLAPAQGGRHPNGRETNGDSMLVDPWGVVLDRLPREAGVVVGELDHERLLEVRRSLPALTHRTLG
jgi:nitrilase